MESKFLMMLLTIIGLAAATIMCSDNFDLRQERDQLKAELNKPSPQPAVHCPSYEWFSGRGM